MFGRKTSVALGHRWLPILELSSAGHQPILSAEGRYVLMFNGEIYNHQELRTSLETDGSPSWRGYSDTETLLACFAAWGVESILQSAVSMFQIALWDRHKRVLHLAHDWMKEKPLYYEWVNDVFVFASEMKALRQVLYKYVPCRELIERPKVGITISIGQWLRGPLRKWAEDLLDERQFARVGHLDPKPVRETWGQHLDGRQNWAARLWGVLMFQAW